MTIPRPLAVAAALVTGILISLSLRTTDGLPGVASAVAATPASAPASCEALAGLPLASASVTTAQLVEAGRFTAPAPARGPAPRFDDLPAFCRVLGSITTSASSSVRFEVWLPAQGWNGNFLVNGFAFYGGTMNPATLANALRQGYATATTDLGGDGTTSAAYLMGHPQSLVDWNERGWHETTLRAKALVSAYYGRNPGLSYWESCGGGTRQGLQEVARYPADFDALSAGGLSNGTTYFTFAQVRQWEATHRDPASLIPRAQLEVLHRAVLKACDARDGVADGIIADPEHCRFDPRVVQCAAGSAADCLTPAQVAAARVLYAPVRNSRTGGRISGPLMPGSELSWNSTPSDSPGSFSDDFFRYLVFEDPNWTYPARPINFDGDVALANRPGLRDISAIEPDLRPFFARGGKILMYTGWNDTAIPPLDSVTYYRSIVGKSGAQATSSSLRLYMLPDGGHCPANAGAMNGYFFDPMPVITAWREQGKRPASIEVTHKRDGAMDRSMKVCPYPQRAGARCTG